jgi:hypothetical protein
MFLHALWVPISDEVEPYAVLEKGFESSEHQAEPLRRIGDVLHQLISRSRKAGFTGTSLTMPTTSEGSPLPAEPWPAHIRFPIGSSFGQSRRAAVSLMRRTFGWPARS